MSTNKGNDLARVSKVLNDPADTAEAIAARSDGVFNTGHNVQANAVSNSVTNFSNAPQALQVWNMHIALIDRPTKAWLSKRRFIQIYKKTVSVLLAFSG